MEIETIRLYKQNVPLEMIQKMTNQSLHQVLKILHYKLVQEQQEIKESKRILYD